MDLSPSQIDIDTETSEDGVYVGRLRQPSEFPDNMALEEAFEGKLDKIDETPPPDTPKHPDAKHASILKDVISRKSMMQIRSPVKTLSRREKIRRLVESLPVRALVLFVILLDCALLIYDEIRNETDFTYAATWAVLAFYTLELGLRIAVVPRFFRGKINLLDVAVIITSIVFQSLENRYSKAIVVARFSRFLRFACFREYFLPTSPLPQI